jgi:hypothetical protein
MNRVRIVAVTAVALGAAVVAGSQLDTQASVEAPALAQAVVPVQPPEAPSLAQLAETPVQPAAAGLQTASVAGILPQPEGEATPQMASASILPGVPVATAAAGPDPVATQIADSVLHTPGPSPEAVPLDPQLQAELNACAVWLVVTPAADSMLEASVYAPCDREAPVTLSHAGLRFDARIGADGQMMMVLPALVEEASVSLTFADGREQSDTTLVPGLSQMERVALHWQGPATLSLHAYEFGAAWGEPGHVHAGSLRATAEAGQGFVTALGDPLLGQGNQVQVYSFPRGQSVRSGQVMLEIEVPVTDASCGQPLNVQAIEVHGTATVQVRQISLDLPACDGNGGYVVMPGILPDLQIAMN